MGNISKTEIDRMVDRFIQENKVFQTRKELENMLDGMYTATQRERIWSRYRYRISKKGISDQ